MPRNRKNQLPEIVKEIKKERLRRHLDDVEALIGEWIHQLSAPEPFHYFRGGAWGWQRGYQPPIEEDIDKNHIIRNHLRNRTLWSHHARWLEQLNRVFTMHESIIRDQKPPESEPGMEYTDEYVRTALWQAFLMASGRERSMIEYRLTDDGNGVKFGAYPIIKASASPDCGRIRKEHGKLIGRLKATKEMKSLATEWLEIVKIQESMQAIASDMLKSSGFLSPCRFCRKLWY